MLKILISTLSLFSAHEDGDSGKNSQRLSSRYPSSRPKISKNIDNVSFQLLKKTDPKLLEFAVPYKTIGDGNCLFRAVSIAAYNDESWHTQLRWHVFQEIRDYPEWYDKDDPNYCSPFANDMGIHLENYSYYFVTTPKDGVWSDINHILAISAVLNAPIMSYFPSVETTVSSYSRIVIGRNVLKPVNFDNIIRIMWTSTEFPKNIENFIPNHFVPLITKKTSHNDPRANRHEEIKNTTQGNY